MSIYNLPFISLIPIDALFALSLALSLTLSLTLTISFALCADVISEHSTENEVLLGSQLMQRTGDDESDGLQTLASPEIHVQVLLSGRLQQVGNTLTLQSLYGQFTVILVTCEQHHVAHTFMQLVDVVHQYLHLCGNRCCRSHRFIIFKLRCKGTAN